MYSVIIPSRTASNLRACIGALRAAGEMSRIIVVDDFDAAEETFGCSFCDWQPTGCGYCQSDRAYSGGREEIALGASVEWVRGVKPFVFSRNINIGIRAAGEDDVVLLNDDAMLAEPPGYSQRYEFEGQPLPIVPTFGRLRDVCKDHPEIGIIGATTNLTGQPLQYSMGRGVRIVPHFAFVCVYIPRRTINLVGMLDERYNVPGYGSDPTVAGACEDRDFCLAVQKAGLKCAVHDFVYVDHGSLRSTFRGDPKTGGDFSGNLALLKEKWKGDFTE